VSVSKSKTFRRQWCKFGKRFVSGHRFSDAAKGDDSERLWRGLARHGTAAKACVLYLLLVVCLKACPDTSLASNCTNDHSKFPLTFEDTLTYNPSHFSGALANLIQIIVGGTMATAVVASQQVRERCQGRARPAFRPCLFFRHCCCWLLFL
jgi:hypothetical protein